MNSQPTRIPGQLTIGLAGGSGAGKSTIAERLRDTLAPLSTEVIGLDRFFKPTDQLPRYRSKHHGEDRPDWNQPGSLDVDRMVAECSQPVDADVMILDGHLALCYPELRALMDLTCYVEASVDEMLERRTARNLANNYGGDRETILHYNRECVLPGYERHIAPSKTLAQVVIPNGDDAEQTRRAIEQLVSRIRQAFPLP